MAIAHKILVSIYHMLSNVSCNTAEAMVSHAAANEYLENEYLPVHNRRFARPPANPENYHGREPGAKELRQIFRLETERAISNVWVIRHEGHCLQLQPGTNAMVPAKARPLVCEWEDGTMEVTTAARA